MKRFIASLAALFAAAFVTGALAQAPEKTHVIIAVGGKSTLTDANGAYLITGINPGSGTITATLSGYKTVSATVAFQASTEYLFSPTMYPTSVTPPATSLQGVIVDGSTGTPIAGASVAIGATVKVTDPSGKFAFSPIAAGSLRWIERSSEIV